MYYVFVKLQIFQQSVEEIAPTLAQRRQRYETLKITCQPAIFATLNADGTNSYHVLVDKLHYHFKNVLKAVDISFKLHFVLGLKYPYESTQIYTFIQRYYYGIETKHDHVSPDLSVMLGALK